MTNKHIFIGIDVGLTGGMTALDEDCNIVYMVRFDNSDVVTVIRDSLEHLRLRYSVPDTKFHLAVEKVHAFHGQGAASGFNFGVSFGIIQGALSALGYAYALYPPQEWQKRLPVAEASKGRVKALAEKLGLLERFIFDRCRVPHSGCLDAFGIAYYHRLVTIGLVEPKKQANEGVKKRRAVMKF